MLFYQARQVGAAKRHHVDRVVRSRPGLRRRAIQRKQSDRAICSVRQTVDPFDLLLLVDDFCCALLNAQSAATVCKLPSAIPNKMELTA